MKEFSVVMSLVDYIPVILFILASFILMHDLYNKMSKGAFALFSCGMIDIGIAGIAKATYKLLYACGICDFEALNNLFFPLQSLGFIIAGIGIVAMLTHKQTKTSALAVVPVTFSGTFLFVACMCLGLGMIDTSLSILACKIKKPYLIVFFTLSFLCSVCMGYLSSKDFSQAYMNWIAEFINIAGQGCLLLGSYLAHKNGLAELKLREEVID